MPSVPYAAPPIGERRWTAPQPPESWAGIRETMKQGRSCPQLVPFELQSEDCLYVSVYVPTVNRIRNQNGTSDPQLWPVMIWIHGGLFCRWIT